MCSFGAYLYIIKSGQQPQQLSRTKTPFSQEVCFKHWQVRGGIEGRLLHSVCNDAGGPLPRRPWLTSPFLELPLCTPETTVAHTHRIQTSQLQVGNLRPDATHQSASAVIPAQHTPFPGQACSLQSPACRADSTRDLKSALTVDPNSVCLKGPSPCSSPWSPILLLL